MARNEPPAPPPGPLSRLRRDLAGPRGYQRVDALLSSPDPAAAVAALSPPALFELVTQVGFADCTDLIALATPEQIRGCLDLDLWDRDRPLVDTAQPWLAAVIEAGFEKVGEVWDGLDPELRALVLQRHTRIWDLSLGEEPDESSGLPWYFTPDTFFCVELQGDEDHVRHTRQLLEDLYRADPVLARHSIMAAHSEPASELEETAYRWRSGRLADLGYVDFYEALDLFQPLEPDQVTIGEGTQERPDLIDDEDHAPRALPATIAEQVVSRSFLARALDAVADPAEAERLEGAILIVTNKVLSAARVKPGDLDALRRGAAYATSTVSLGLEIVARGDVERAAATLASVSLTRLHRVGHTIALKLARLARGLAAGAALAGAPAADVVDALVRPRPWLSRVLDDPPGPGVRPFESQADLRRVAEVLSRLTLRVAIAEALGVDLRAVAELPEPRPALDDHARTALVRVVTGGPLSSAPLTGAELTAFRAAGFDGAALRDDAGERAQAAIAGLLDRQGLAAGRDALPALVAGWLADLERTFGGLTGAIDGRFVDGVLVAATRS